MMQSVQVIIERLKSHPEDFFGDMEGRLIGRHAPKFNAVREKLDNLLTEPQDGHTHRLWYLEPEEKEALLAAYKEARRARFEAKVFHTLLTAQEPDPQYDINMDRPYQKPSKIIAPASMVKQAREILNKEFEKEYAKNRNP